VVGLCVAAFSSAYILDESRYQFQSTKQPELLFRAILGSGDSRELHFLRSVSR
jgi:hypothetical protein